MKQICIFGLALWLLIIPSGKLFSQDRLSFSDTTWVYDFQSEVDSTFQQRKVFAVYDSADIREMTNRISSQLNGDWEMGFRFWIRFNPQRQNLMEIGYNWDTDQWVEDHLYQWAYDRQGNDTLWHLSYSDGAGGWVPAEGYRYENSYNELDQLTESIRYMGYPGQESLYSKSEYSYDTTGNVNLWNYYDYATDWVLNYREETAYDSLSREVEKIIYSLSGDELAESSRIIHEYDTSGNTTVLEQYAWETDPGEWRLYYREDLVYDLWGHQISRIVQRSYSAGLPQPWVTTRYLNYYNPSGKLRLTEISEMQEGEVQYQLIRKEFHRYGGDYFIRCDSICSGEVYSWQGDSYSSGGTYRKEYISAMGMDSIYTLYLKVNPLPTTFGITGSSDVVQDQEVLYTAPEDESLEYRWSVENGTVLSGADNDTLMVMWETLGTGEVSAWALNEYGCSSDTATLMILIGLNGTDDPYAATFVLYPVPVQKLLQVECGLEYPEIRVMDLSGRQVAVARGTSIDLSHLPSGTYVVHLRDQKGALAGSRKIMKE